MTTAANVKKADQSHWYHRDGKPCYEIPKAKGDGMRAPTVRDARKMDLLPSVTTILKVLHKEALVNWLIEQAVLAVVTTPRLPGEADDAFITRVLQVQKVQDEEVTIARERGTAIHDALQFAFQGFEIPGQWKEWVLPVFQSIRNRGAFLFAEKVVVGPGYAGMLDLALIHDNTIEIIDWKSTSKLPERESWDEHKLQLAAYARAVQTLYPDKKITTSNAYISTKEKGAFAVFDNGDWANTFEYGFLPLMNFWQWSKTYYPTAP